LDLLAPAVRLQACRGDGVGDEIATGGDAEHLDLLDIGVGWPQSVHESERGTEVGAVGGDLVGTELHLPAGGEVACARMVGEPVAEERIAWQAT
jgi:hypothetical protein